MAAELHISLPESLLAWVQEQATAQGLASSAEFVVQVLTNERRRQLKLRVEQEIRAGLESGPAIPMTADDWVAIRRETEARINAR
ncbi:MAG: hypothetical protein JNM18_20120 [Planctomycetaceae bacterium]|nr:hypothetical protein [Planctomycetaceae bacterium]